MARASPSTRTRAGASTGPEPSSTANEIASASLPSESRLIGIGRGATPASCSRQAQNGWSAKNGTGTVGTPAAIPAPVVPAKRGEFGLYVSGQWYRLALRSELVPVNDPVARLDARLLSDWLLGPVLGIRDLRRDKRIDYVGGSRGLEGLEKRVNSGEMAAAFALYPTSMEDLMSVADAGAVMPTKSTWFDPKLADGMVSHVLD